MGYKYKVGKTKAKEYAVLMNDIEEFCIKNGIYKTKSGDSYYFTLNGINYRVSNHTVSQSNQKAFSLLNGQVRELYHLEWENDDTIYITASKARIIDIYNDLKNHYVLDRRGYRKV